MVIKGIIDEDTVNYKKISMYVAFPYCTFKCDKENGVHLCQNSSLALQKSITVGADRLVSHFLNETLSKAIVCCGLEPMDSFEDLMELACELRKVSNADLVVYTGYTEDEVKDKVEKLSSFGNVIIKFGRYIPNQNPHYDEVLGVYLASDNQYAKEYSFK